MMRILQILHDRERGGIVTLAAMIEEGLAEHGAVVETDYLFPRPGLNTLAKLSCAAAMARRIVRGGFDALIAYQATASILVGAIGRLQGCQVRIVHQTCTPGATALPVRIADKLVGALGLYTVNIANSVATRAEFDRYPLPYRRSMVLIEHGLDKPAPTRSRAETRRKFSLPQAAPILLNVGRLVAQKNQDVLIRALAYVPNAHLAIAGDGANGVAYRARAADLGVGERLHLLGALSSEDVTNLYAAADLFVFPSVWETFGLAAVEAAMAGLPMVVADLAVLREVLSTEVSQPVAFVAPDDVPGWVSKINAALGARPSPELVTRFADTITQKYSRERMIESYVGLLKTAAAA
ncbi:MAG TPA: glycosyltransferase family 4 protein [Burkholderiales bacterium]|nr:glycosyltransferase family 4 protein [Burkholderiales bacterium]